MKKQILTSMLMISSLTSFAGETPAELDKKAERATKTMVEIVNGKEIPKSLINKADCIASVTIHRGGLAGFGAKSGQGLASCRTEDGWSNPSFININGANLGPQIGFGKLSMVMVLIGEKSVEQLKRKNMTGDASLSIVAGPVGREATAGVDFKLDNGIYSYSKAKGLYFGATLGAAMISPDKSSNLVMYGGNDDYIPSLILETPASDDLSDAFKGFIESIESLGDEE